MCVPNSVIIQVSIINVMGFSYMNTLPVQLNPFSTLCLNYPSKKRKALCLNYNIAVSHSHQYPIQKAIGCPMNASSYYLIKNRFYHHHHHVLSSDTSSFHGLKHIYSLRLLPGPVCGGRFYHANQYALQVYNTPRTTLQVYKARISGGWQWIRTRKYSFIKIFIIFFILFTRFERIPYSNRIHMVTPSHKLERCIGMLQWKYMEKKYQGSSILDATHPQSVRVKSILRVIVQGMHNGLVLNPKSVRYGSEGTLLVESEKRPKKSIIRYGTKHLEGLNWEVMVVESDQENAEYIPDGKIVIYTGLLDILNSEAEIASVLGHEVGHGVARHASENWMRVPWTLALTWPFQHELILPKIVAQVSMYISRRRELEADYIGLMLMASAGYDPQIAPNIYESFDYSREDLSPKFYEKLDYEDDLLSTHPSGRRRARLLKENKVMGEALAIYNGVRSGNGVKCFV